MEELISSAGDVGRELLATVPDLAGLLASARTSVSHPGAEGPDALARYWLGEALIWVLRVRLLAELGVPVSDLSARVIQKPAFQNILRELASFQPSSPGKPGNGLARWRRWLHRTMSLLRRFFRWWRAGRAATLFTNPRQDLRRPRIRNAFIKRLY